MKRTQQQAAVDPYEAMLRTTEDLECILHEERLSGSGRAMVENSLALLRAAMKADSNRKVVQLRDAIKRRGTGPVRVDRCQSVDDDGKVGA